MHVMAAMHRLGVREVGFTNYGGWVTTFLARARVYGPAPWCAAFVYWALMEAGADPKKLWPSPSSTWSLAVWASKQGRLFLEPARGMAFVWNSGSLTRFGRGHTGMVKQREGNFYLTLEGNTNDNGGREGYKVASRRRHKAERGGLTNGLHGFVSFKGCEL